LKEVKVFSASIKSGRHGKLDLINQTLNSECKWHS